VKPGNKGTGLPIHVANNTNSHHNESHLNFIWGGFLFLIINDELRIMSYKLLITNCQLRITRLLKVSIRSSKQEDLLYLTFQTFRSFDFL